MPDLEKMRATAADHSRSDAVARLIRANLVGDIEAREILMALALQLENEILAGHQTIDYLKGRLTAAEAVAEDLSTDDDDDRIAAIRLLINAECDGRSGDTEVSCAGLNLRDKGCFANTLAEKIRKVIDP